LPEKLNSYSFFLNRYLVEFDLIKSIFFKAKGYTGNRLRLTVFWPIMSSNSSLPESMERLVQRLQRLTDPKQRYQQLILYGQKLPPFAESDKLPQNLVSGCVSQVFITVKLSPQGKVEFAGESDALITKGFVGFLIAGLNGLEPWQIEAVSPDFIQQTGLNVSLTPSRANGFINVFKTMQQKVGSLQITAHD
jgi:cysteine desulfuration protein SufE